MVELLGRNLVLALHTIAPGRSVELKRTDAVQNHALTLGEMLANNQPKLVQDANDIALRGRRPCRYLSSDALGRRHWALRHYHWVPELLGVLIGQARLLLLVMNHNSNVLNDR